MNTKKRILFVLLISAILFIFLLEYVVGISISDCRDLNGHWVGVEDPNLGSCCGEDSDNDGNPDSNEFFSKWIYGINDDKNSACWNSAPFINFVKVDESGKIVHYNGSFYGCKIEGTEYPDLVDTETNEPLIPEENSLSFDDEKCDVIGSEEKGYYFCSHEGTWNFSSFKRNATKKAPLGIQIPYNVNFKEEECCAPDQCWNGTDCIGESNLPEADIEQGDTKLKCKDGEWVDVIEKYDQNNEFLGLCAPEECYYYDYYTGASVCVPNGNWTEDYYCHEGMWATRTNLIVSQLIELAGSSDYTLFCDYYDRALNDLQFFLAGVKNYAEFLLYGNVNNFCVIKYNDEITGKEKVAFGVSLNIPVNTTDTDHSILNVFPESQKMVAAMDHYDYCDGVIKKQEDRYLGCNGPEDYKENEEWNLWYNAKTNSIIYSEQGINIGERGLFQNILNFLIHPINSIASLFSSPDQESLEYVESLNFNQLYINKKGDKIIRGVVDDMGVMRISYENIGTNICNIIKEKEKFEGLMEGTISCEAGFGERGVVFYVSSEYPYIADLYWSDLTAKIRLNERFGDLEEGDFIDSVNAEQIEWNKDFGDGIPVNFKVELKDIDNSDIIGYMWDFGDGGSLRSDNFDDVGDIIYLYLKKGTYKYSFAVIDRNLRYDEKEGTIKVKGFENGENCSIDGQCESGFCAPTSEPEKKICKESTCFDGYKGPDETDIDCGGVCVGEGKLCMAGQKCNKDEDCITGECINGKCASPILTCSVKQDCSSDEAVIFKMSSITNAHAELPSQNNYDYKVCCKLDRDVISTECDEKSAVALKLSSETNAHVSQGNIDDYDYKVCISAKNNKVSCDYATSCTGTCIASISSRTNAHVGDCSAYPLKVCCGFGAVTENVCGNGILEAGEECDDGNTEGGDGCSPDCKIECPDGVIEGSEECDDGNNINDDYCSNECKINYKYIFITNSVYNGNLGGFKEADAKCQQEAEEAGLPGEYKAWLFVSNIPAKRFIHSAKPYKLPDNTTVASTFSDLTAGNLQNPINKNAFGNAIDLTTSSFAWTGSAMNNCNDWQSNDATESGVVGDPTKTDTSWKKTDSTRTCDAAFHLYCLQNKTR